MEEEFNNFLNQNNLKINNDLLTNFSKSNENVVITDKWYNSLENNNPDFSVYEDDFFLYASLDCFKKYSCKYINGLISIRNKYFYIL